MDPVDVGRLEACDERGEVVGTEGDPEVPHAGQLLRQHLLGTFLQRELQPVEPDVDPPLLHPAGAAPQLIDVERAGGVEVRDGERQVQDRIHARQPYGVAPRPIDGVSRPT